MALKFLDPRPGFSDPAGGLQTLNAGDSPLWDAPDSSRKALDARAEWTGPELAPQGVFGVTFPGFPSVTKGVRTDKAAKFGDVHPAIANGTGDSPFDNISPWCDMVPEERAGGTMVPIKKFWYKLTQNGSCVDIQIANVETDGFSVSPAHMDRNDDKGERNVVYVGRYHCATGTYHSTTKVMPANNANKATIISNIGKIGNTYHMMDWATRFTLWLLYLVETAEWNSQNLIGFGCGNNYALENMGYTDDMKYCTGTTQASTSTKAIGTQYRNIEGLWDNVWDILSGCYNDNRGFNVITDTAKLGDHNGGKLVGMPSSGWVGELKVSDSGGFPAFYASNTSGGSDSAGTCDVWHFAASNPVLYVGGDRAQNTNRGMFCMGRVEVTTSYEYLGCRLLELP